LLIHGEIAGVVPGDRSYAQQSGAVLEPGELHADQWDYIALGHYHVAGEVMSNAWYSGSIEYTSHTPWSESRDGSSRVPEGAKGWLLVTLDDGNVRVEFKPVALTRRHIDLQPIYCSGMTADEISEVIRNRVDDVEGGIDGQIVRQVLFDVPRNVVRDLDHATIREYKAKALHYRFDPRRPEVRNATSVTAPGRRQTMQELVTEYLTERTLTPGVSRDEVLELAREYLGKVERNLAEI